ncbi:MAG: peptidylprolyl isomerase [Crocinitomix sp.]|nr:peptidylprolyl isomerase [Crocinitomix sp.]
MKKIFLFAPALFLFACGGEEDVVVEDVVDVVETIIPEEIIPELVASPLSSDEEIQAFLEGKSWESQEPDENGMYIVIDEPGEGDARPVLSDEVTIFYAGHLLDGLKFDGTAEAPATFALTQLIKGWQIGIPKFGKGGKGKLIIPSDLAYGPEDNREIPGGSTLMFEIALVDWAPAL